MFRSHLTYPHVASDAHAHTLQGDLVEASGGAMPGMGDVGADAASVPQIPAPLSTSGDLVKRLLLIGGIAAIVFLVLKHLNKK